MKKIYVFVLVALTVIMLSACGDIEDTNGDKTELVTISLEKLRGKSIGGSSNGFDSRSTRNNFTINTLHEDIDLDSLIRDGGMSSGTFNIMATELKAGESLTIYSNVTVSSGNIELILIDDNYNLIHQFKIGQEDSITVKADETKEYIVRFGAESYSGRIELERVFD
jgi:hypothetical protein